MFKCCLKVVAGSAVTDQLQDTSLVQGTMQRFCKVEEAAQRCQSCSPKSWSATATILSCSGNCTIFFSCCFSLQFSNTFWLKIRGFKSSFTINWTSLAQPVQVFAYLKSSKYWRASFYHLALYSLLSFRKKMGCREKISDMPKVLLEIC